jgi:hypothetical protein
MRGPACDCWTRFYTPQTVDYKYMFTWIVMEDDGVGTIRLHAHTLLIVSRICDRVRQT